MNQPLRTHDEWKAIGYRVRENTKPEAYNELKLPLFDVTQTFKFMPDDYYRTDPAKKNNGSTSDDRKGME